jgi:tRNA(Phe) wybutosine-synthesizing methylase Tyw3
MKALNLSSLKLVCARIPTGSRNIAIATSLKETTIIMVERLERMPKAVAIEIESLDLPLGRTRTMVSTFCRSVTFRDLRMFIDNDNINKLVMVLREKVVRARNAMTQLCGFY